MCSLATLTRVCDTYFGNVKSKIIIRIVICVEENVAPRGTGVKVGYLVEVPSSHTKVCRCVHACACSCVCVCAIPWSRLMVEL